MTNLKFTLPFVWPSVAELTGQTRNNPTIPFDHALENVASIFGIVSDVDDRGVTWLETFLKQRSELAVRIILAVYAGCPTRSRHLTRLLDLQTQATDKVMFRILPKIATGAVAPANCLAAVPVDKIAPVFLFGPTPNFSIDGADQTQVNMAFKAEIALFNQWWRWFDVTWFQAVPLTETTADIPALVPSPGSVEAAAQWEAYCNRCDKSKQSVPINSDTPIDSDTPVNPDTKEVQDCKQPAAPEDLTSIPLPDQRYIGSQKMANRSQLPIPAWFSHSIFQLIPAF